MSQSPNRREAPPEGAELDRPSDAELGGPVLAVTVVMLLLVLAVAAFAVVASRKTSATGPVGMTVILVGLPSGRLVAQVTGAPARRRT
jgi:hypothetical protein